MNEKILETVVSSFVQEFLNQCKDLFSDVYDEGKAFIGTDLKKYLEKKKINTLI